MAGETKNSQLRVSNESLDHLLEDDQTCAVCLESYMNPINLLCKHKFCEECVKLLAETSLKIACPLCRVETNLPDNTQPKDATSTSSTTTTTTTTTATKSPGRLKASLLSSSAKVIIPRNIKLLEEYDAAIGKSGADTYIPDVHCGFITYGLDESKQDNHNLTHWNAIIIGPQDSPIGLMIYNLSIEIPDAYPKEQPIVKFVSPKICMECVDKKGNVDLSMIERIDLSLEEPSTGQVMEGTGDYFSWSIDNNIADILVKLRENMYLDSVSNQSSEYSDTNYNDDDDNYDENNEDDNNY
eukprot:TRINITY_DN1802_c0_g1_i1.p1 TRINITY_DN1802_c0_g1~~TRINITY_DN1802_c0_g1_i1.p1  ORF type:complete len:298 (+),score=60.08 TRINITY_DN1802_c0_g1_i1:127-1020(+)